MLPFRAFSNQRKQRLYDHKTYLDELEIGKVQKFRQVLKASAVIQLIVDNDVVLGVLFAKENGNMGCDKPCVVWQARNQRSKETFQKGSKEERAKTNSDC